jgi:hypothetical protein
VRSAEDHEQAVDDRHDAEREQHATATGAQPVSRASHAGSSAIVSTAVPARSVTHPKPTASPLADARPRKLAHGAREPTINTIAAATGRRRKVIVACVVVGWSGESRGLQEAGE